MENIKDPSVVRRAIAAFLLPIVVFIASLAAFGWVLAKASPHQFFSCFAFESFLTKNWFGAKELLTALSFLLALATTSVCVLIIKVINSRFSKNK